VFDGLVLVLFLTATTAASGESPGAAPPVRAENPMVRDIVFRMEQSGRTEPDLGKRRIIFRDAAEALPRALFPAILDSIVPAPPDSIDWDIARAVFLRWAWETPDFAAHWAIRSSPGPFRMEALAEAVGRWRAKNPDEALRWEGSLSLDDRQGIDANEAVFSGRADVATPKKGGG
jgi:hypothetical protein